jgi:hypothetical protein
MAVAARVREPLQQQHRAALGPARAVGGRGERFAPAVRREPALPAELDEHAGGREHCGGAGQREGALAAFQRLRGEVQGHQRRRTRGVDRQRRAVEAEGVGDPAGRHARGGPGQDPAGETVRRFVETGAVVAGGRADEDADGVAAAGRHVDAGALEGLP